MSVNGSLTAVERQRWYWRQEMESTHRMMSSFPSDSPEHIQWKKQYELACRIYNRLYDKPKEE